LTRGSSADAKPFIRTKLGFGFYEDAGGVKGQNRTRQDRLAGAVSSYFEAFVGFDADLIFCVNS
jgi:hypothetical protein